MGLYGDIPTHNVPHFQLHCESKCGIVQYLQRGIVDHCVVSMSSLQFEVQQATTILSYGDVNGCFKYNSHSYFRKSLRQRYSSFFHERWKEFHTLQREKPPCYHHMLFFMWLGCFGFPNEIDPMMSSTWLLMCVDLNPCLVMCWESKASLLTNQEGDRWASHY